MKVPEKSQKLKQNSPNTVPIVSNTEEISTTNLPKKTSDWSDFILSKVLYSDPKIWGKTPTTEEKVYLYTIFKIQNSFDREKNLKKTFKITTDSDLSPMKEIEKSRRPPGVIGAGAKKCGTIAFSTFMALNPEVIYTLQLLSAIDHLRFFHLSCNFIYTVKIIHPAYLF